MSGVQQFIVAALFYALFIVGVSQNAWRGNHELHSILETCATLIAVFVAFLALIRYFARRDLNVLMISAAFFGATFLNGFHVLTTSNVFLESVGGQWVSLSPWSWMSERLFLGLYLLATADTLWSIQRSRVPNQKLHKRSVYAVVLLSILILLYFALLPQPEPYISNAPLGRPQEVFPALFYSLAFLAFFRLQHWRKRSIDQWIMHSLLLALMAQVCMSLSNEKFDNYHDAAHVLKTLGYAILLYGLSRDIYNLYDDEERTRGQLSEHEMLLAEAQEIAHVGNWEWQIEANQLHWSDELYRIFGTKPSHKKVKFESYIDLVHEDDRMMVKELIQRCYDKGDDYNVMHRVVHKGKDIRWLQSRGKAVRNAAGDIVRLLGTAQDVTESHLNEERFRKLLEAAPDGMVICDEQGKISLVNAQAETLFGYLRKELIGVSMEILVPERYRDKHEGHRHHYFKEPVTRNMGAGLELFGQRKDGREFPIEISLSPFTTPKGRMVIAAVRDVTESRKAQQELARYAKELERSNAELERFAYVASHDMKEPLRKIQAFGDRLVSRYSDVLDDTANDYVARMQDAAQRMSMLIEDMLTYSRIEIRSGAWEPVNLQKLLDSSLHNLDMAIQECAAQVTADKLPEVEGHPWQLEMLLQNLLSNALKYRDPERSPIIKITVAHKENGFVEITLTDNGIGFDTQYGEKIFQPFERLHTNKQYPGTGIGLSICRKIVEHHQGSITASGVPNQGARFVILLPVKQETVTQG